MKGLQFAVGSYTQVLPHVPGGCGKGISIISFNEQSGEIRVIQTIEEIENPSWLHWDPERELLYSISESEENEGYVRTFRRDSGGFFRESSSLSVSGRACCHLLPLPERDLLFIASYGDGRCAAFSMTEGEPRNLIHDFIYNGKGLNPARQEASHAHQISVHRASSSVYVCDLGCDLVRRHSLAAPGLNESTALKLPGGWGPRHLALDPELPAAYILCELEPRLVCAGIVTEGAEQGRMEILETHDTVSADEFGKAAPAAVKIHPSGRAVYVSNRFTDTLTLFSIDRSSGQPRLKRIDEFGTGGKTPRDFSFSPDGGWLLAAGQNSDEIRVRRLDTESGTPAADWLPPFSINTPVCLVPLV